MLTTSDKYVTYSQFTRLWSTQFTNMVITRKVRMGYCSICANLKSIAKGAKTTKEKGIHKKTLQVSRLGGMRGMRLSTKREQERKQDHKIINDK